MAGDDGDDGQIEPNSGPEDGEDDANLLAQASIEALDALVAAEISDVTDETDVARERRERLTAHFAPEIAALLSDEDLERIEREEAEKALADRREKALEEVRVLARMEARVEHGLIDADVLRDDREKQRQRQKVKVRINLPRGGGALGMYVDGRLLQHGEVHTVTRAQFDSMREMHYRMHRAEREFHTLDQDWRNGTTVSQLMTDAPPPFEVVSVFEDLTRPRR